MASQGPNSPSTATNVALNGFAWTSAGFVLASDDLYATRLVNGTSDYLRATNFGFSIPAGATINGFLVEVEYKSSAAFAIQDSTPASAPDTHKLLKASSPVGTGQPDNAGTFWPAADTYKSYGGPTNLFGTTWTDTDINSSGFGFQLSADSFSKSPPTASVDHIRITVFYTGGGAAFIAAPAGRFKQAIHRASNY